MLNWLLNFEGNGSESFLKHFYQLALGKLLDC